MKRGLHRRVAGARLKTSDARARVARSEVAEAGLRRAQLMAGLAHVVTGPRGEFESWSETLPELIGVAPSRMPASTREWLEYIHPEDRALFRDKCIATAREGLPSYVEYRLRGPSGSWINVRQIMEPIRAGQRAPRWFNTLQDVTHDRRVTDRLGRALEQSRVQARSLGELTRRVTTLQEKERRDLARELHDRVGQNLALLGIHLARLRAEASGRESAERIADCQALLEATGRLVQDLLTELKPPMLASYGLLEALRWHARDFALRTGIAVDIGGADPEPRLGAEIEMALFRITQAALTNVAQHAGAKHIWVRLERNGPQLGFEVRDDGKGFDPERAIASGRWGLTAMRERAEAIGGRLRIVSAPGKGARLIVEARAE